MANHPGGGSFLNSRLSRQTTASLVERIMKGKAEIAFLLNPNTKAEMQTPKYNAAATPPPLSLFQSLSPVVRLERVALSLSPIRKTPVTYAPIEKHFNNVRCDGTNNTRLPLLSLAAIYTAGASSSSRASHTPPVRGSKDYRSSSPHSTSQSHGANSQVRKRKTHTRLCQAEGCSNLAVSRGCCVRHGGGSRCSVAGCCKRAKLYQRCFQHGGYKTCTEPGCTKKAKRYGHCWSHGGGRICEIPDCTKVSTQGGLCWAHGGGNRCKLEGCSRRSYQKYGYYCVHHSKLSSNSEIPHIGT
ncbi:hypothetical protein L915_08871 [Phytophthora nicotianae]|uniref:WRKY19-like zinc finger domain-containing protein n=1 Tax=Phytophthora nicotianae TaxID=4792 RepID=W2J0I2_PHYNI|nr:hypothetical protein L915_08871 [Phytophthora nicotianae]ETL39920.1 hypothetical protein L916_08794 [Phytophthora nicotianae]